MNGQTARRAVDVTVSALALIGLAPVLGAVTVAVRVESPGPVLFGQTRVGRDGVQFRILKFRSMVDGAERIGPQVSGRNDPRVTRVGAVLRATKLDELPQLWNMLRGDMTLVGPRAEVPEMVRYYTDEEWETLRVKPGLTGPGQIYFTSDQAAELDGVDDVEAHYVEYQLHPKLALDLVYLRHRTWRSDLAVVGRTVLLLLGAGRRIPAAHV